MDATEYVIPCLISSAIRTPSAACPPDGPTEPPEPAAGLTGVIDKLPPRCFDGDPCPGAAAPHGYLIVEKK